MSVRTMSTMAARSGTGNKKAALDTTLGKIAAFIPSEILALYLFMWGVAEPKPADKATPWALFWWSLVALVLYVALNHFLDRKTINTANAKIAEAEKDKRVPLPSAGKAVIVLLMAAVAFTAYAAALPQAPFLQVNTNANTIGAIVAAALAIFLPQVGKLFGVSPDTEN